jgi:hypothetical protein
MICAKSKITRKPRSLIWDNDEKFRVNGNDLREESQPIGRLVDVGSMDSSRESFDQQLH